MEENNNAFSCCIIIIFCMCYSQNQTRQEVNQGMGKVLIIRSSENRPSIGLSFIRP